MRGDNAVHEEAIRKAVNFGLGKPTATTIMGPDWALNPNVKPRPYDPEKAKALLTEAGWDPTQTLTYLLVGSDAFVKSLAEVFQQYLSQISVKVDLKTVTSAVEIPEFDKGEFDVGLIGGGEFARDPSLSAAYFRSDTSWASKWMGYANPRLDELFKQGVATNDPKKRADVYFEVQQILSDEVPWILLWQLEQPKSWRRSPPAIPWPDRHHDPELCFSSPRTGGSGDHDDADRSNGRG